MDYSTTPSSRPDSRKSGRSQLSQPSSWSTEQTPLLLAREDAVDEGEEQEIESIASQHDAPKPIGWRQRWPSILALFLLCVAAVLIMLGFLATNSIEEYAMQAADFRPTSVSLDSLTKRGVQVHVQGDFTMDAAKVRKTSVRNIGRLGTWIAREVESGPAQIHVYLPKYDNVLLGTARVPGIKVNIRNGHTTHVSFMTQLEPGSFDQLRNIVNDFIHGHLGNLKVKGVALVPLESGLIHLGKQTVEQVLVLHASRLPTLPRYNITKVNLREAKHGNKGLGADVSVALTNSFPVQLAVPPVAVDVLVNGCLPDKLIAVGTAETAALQVHPNTDILVNVTGHVEELPDALTAQCPNSAKSPLDALLGDYMQGQEATVYVNCCKFPDPSTPDWARDLLKDITVPIPFAGKDMGNLIKNFSLSDVRFSLPQAFAEPGSPESNPLISAVIKVLIGLPNEMNFPLDVKHIKADADILYHGKKFGVLDLKKWQDANSTRIEGNGEEGPSLLVEANIKDAPINITDSSAFLEIVQKIFWSGQTVMLDIDAAVSVEVDTPMGQFAVRDIPAEGKVPVKPIGGGKGHNGGPGLGALGFHMGNLSIVDTSKTSLTLQAHANFTNPTNYSAVVPYFNIHVIVNDTLLGEAIVEDVVVRPGNNTNVVAKVIWDPFTHSGEDGVAVGSEFLSQYISGFNTTFTFQTHSGSIPAQPFLGTALARFPINFPAPPLGAPDDDNDPGSPGSPKKGHFIRDTVMHILTSTAIFTLASPFSSTTLYVTHLNATAFYKGHPAGKILYDLPFAVPPGLSSSPRLPVNWSLGSMGYEAIKKALGGELRLSAFARVGVRIGEWRSNIWYKGGSIGAKVRL